MNQSDAIARMPVPSLSASSLATPLRGIIFDVDGVLFDSRNSNTTYYNMVRRALHLPPMTNEEEEYSHMAAVTEVFARIIPVALLAEAMEAAKTINYENQILPLLKPEEGLLEALHWLRHHGIYLGICTNRTNSVGKLLHYFGLEEFFSPVRTAENSPPKPHPGGLLAALDTWGLPAAAIGFVGDSKVDEQAAYAAQIPFWAYKNPNLRAALHFSGFYDLIQSLGPLVERKNTL